MARVLIVEDSVELGGVLARQCRNVHDVVLVADAGHALDELASGAFDVVVADFNLAGQDGVSLLEQVRAAHPSVRRVLMSGGDVPDLDVHVASGLVQAFITKPNVRLLDVI